MRVGSGYAFGTATGTYYQYTETTNSETEEAVNYSFGKGINNQLAFGFMVNEHFGFELGLGYLKGLKSEFKSSQNTQHGTSSSEMTHRANMISIMPSVVFKGSSDGISPFARVGMVAGSVKGISDFKYSYSDQFGTGNSEGEIEETGGVTLGLTAALGVQFPVSEKLSFYLEGNLMQLAWAPKKGELTKAIEDGEDVLSQLSTEEKEWTYKDEVTYSNGPGGSPDNEFLREKRPMSNAGVALGLMFTF